VDIDGDDLKGATVDVSAAVLVVIRGCALSEETTTGHVGRGFLLELVSSLTFRQSFNHHHYTSTTESFFPWRDTCSRSLPAIWKIQAKSRVARSRLSLATMTSVYGLARNSPSLHTTQATALTNMYHADKDYGLSKQFTGE